MFVFVNVVGIILFGIIDFDICFVGMVYVLVVFFFELILERERKGRIENIFWSFFGFFCDEWGFIFEFKCFVGLYFNGELVVFVCGMYLFFWFFVFFIVWWGFFGDGFFVLDVFFFFGKLDYKVSLKIIIEYFCIIIECV